MVAPLYVWLGAMSSVPHKEERFAYVVYPQVRQRRCVLVTPVVHIPTVQVCLSAAVVLDVFVELCSCRRIMAASKHIRGLATVAVWAAVAGSWLLTRVLALC